MLLNNSKKVRIVYDVKLYITKTSTYLFLESFFTFFFDLCLVSSSEDELELSDSDEVSDEDSDPDEDVLPSDSDCCSVGSIANDNELRYFLSSSVSAPKPMDVKKLIENLIFFG